MPPSSLSPLQHHGSTAWYTASGSLLRDRPELGGAMPAAGLVANSGVGHTMDCTDLSFMLCEPVKVRNRTRVASSARTPSRRPRNQSPFVATGWLQTPGSFVVPCG